MARLCLLGFILAGLLVIQATADTKHQSEGLVSRDKLADRPVSSSAEGSSEPLDGAEAMAPSSIRRLGKHHSDKSVAGGGVIIGGLVTAIFAAVFCYIRVTRKRNSVM